MRLTVLCFSRMNGFRLIFWNLMLTDTQLVGEICIQFAKYIVRLQSYAE